MLDCPIINYCEYYFATSHRDISYRIDLPPAEPAPFFPRCINAPTLATLVDCDAGYSATHWQKQSFPARFHPKIEVHFDGIETELYRPGPAPRRIGERSIPAGTRVVTFVSRGLESIRGFDLFMKVADRIARTRHRRALRGGRRRGDPLRLGQAAHRRAELQAVGPCAGAATTSSRFLFLGRVLPEQLADILRLSDLHIYLTAPFVLSWSLLNAMATGCVVLASDVPPVREVIEPGVNGLVEPLFDVERLTETALEVLDDPAAFAPLGPGRPADDRGDVQPRGLHPAAQGLLRAGRLDGTLRTAGRAAMVRGSARLVPDSAGIRRSRASRRRLRTTRNPAIAASPTPARMRLLGSGTALLIRSW